MNVYWMATITITVVLCLAIYMTARLADRELDRRHEIRWHERFYQPQLPARPRRVIDVETRNSPRPIDRGLSSRDGLHPRY